MSEEALAAAAAACADEPIRVPGSIQPHGALLALDPASRRVVIASRGLEALLGVPAVVGAELGEVLPGAAALVDAVGSGEDPALTDVPLVLADGSAHDAAAHAVDGLVVVELEPARGDERELDSSAARRRLALTLRRLQDARSVQAMCDELATSVRVLTSFDRVMVYRFDAQWNGEVVAEAVRDDLPPLLGLHYPASDIPAQARALYATQWLRIIPDTAYEPVPLVPDRHPTTGAPLDLSSALLRSVSPVHLRYLHNMGVSSSMSISLLHHGELWGLISCHHTSGPHRPSAPVRAAAEFLGRTASLLLPTVTGLDASASVIASQRVRSHLTELVAEHPTQVVDALTREEVTLADLVPCGGAAVRLHGELRLIGDTPAAPDVVDLLTELGPQGLTTGALAADAPALAALARDAEHLTATASGVLAVPVDAGTPGDALVWFRAEVLREVTWGGDPRASKVLVDSGGGLRLDPRHSFAAWSEVVAGTSAPWLPHEVEVATGFARHVGASLLREVERTNRLATALQQTLLLEKLPEVPGLELAARYSPHSDDVVGGDWYDVIILPSGRRAAVLGDVAGHGLAVSAISAQMRNALRAYLLSSEDPGTALERLNDLVVSLLPGELATAVVLVLDADTGEAWVASAGHPPMVHLTGGAARAVGSASGPALGLVDGLEYPSTALHLEPDDVVLLYSDGLVESRDASLDDRIGLLLRTAVSGRSEGAGALESLCDRLLATLSARSDDTTLLAIRRVTGPS